MALRRPTLDESPPTVAEYLETDHRRLDAGSPNGPTAATRTEHVEIGRRLGEVAEGLEARDRSRTKTALDALMGIPSAHNMNEQAILYPMTDRWPGEPGERHALVQRLQAF